MQCKSYLRTLPITTTERIKSMATTKTKTKQKELELSPFANNGHATEYTRMMHRYADLDKREKALRRKQRFANWMLFASIVLVIGCVIGTAFVCTTIRSIGI